VNPFSRNTSIIKEIKLVCDGLKEKLVIPSEEEILAIEKVFRFQGVFDQCILDILRLMSEEQRNVQQKNLEILKEGEKRLL
jgi:hypothetical protein